jgi:DNA-binding LacI/PurR family transcriptional regulator
VTGVQEIAGINEYDILLCICHDDDVASLERILRNRKVDGVVLLRTFLKDRQIEFLMEKGIPFVTTGSTDYKGVKQVDNDHLSACRELTSILLMRRQKRIALIGGQESYVVTRNRYRGFVQAYKDLGMDLDESLIFMNQENKAHIDRAVEEALEKGVDCILCMDDAICGQVLRRLRQEHKKVPEDVRVASFYNSSVLENNIPSITSLSFDARALGAAACSNLLAQIAGEAYEEKMLLSYEIVMGESTK